MFAVRRFALLKAWYVEHAGSGAGVKSPRREERFLYGICEGMIDVAWLCAFAIRCVYWLVLLACNFLGYSTLWAKREIKQRGERYEANRKIPAHVAILNNDGTIKKEMLLSLLEAALAENIRRLTIYDSSTVYVDLAREIQGFCRVKHIKIVVGCINPTHDFSAYRLVVQLLSAECGRPKLVDTCRELSSSKSRITTECISSHLAKHYALCEPDLLIQVGTIPSLCGYPPWCLRVTEIVPVRSLPCSRYAFSECVEAFSRRDIRLGKFYMKVVCDYKVQPIKMAELAHAIPAVDMINATSRLQIEAAEVRASKPNWGSYLRSQMIPQEDYNFISAYENAKSKEERDTVLAANDANGQAARTIVNLITNVAKDQNVRYVLTLLDDMLQEDKNRVEIFHNAARKQKRTAFSWFLGILQRQDNFIVNQMSSIIAKLACFGSTLMEGSELNYYFSFLKDQLKSSSSNEYMNTTARCLQMMLRIDPYRLAFTESEGVQAIVAALNGKTNFQLQYQLAFALWCLTFNPDIARRTPSLGVIQALGDILSESSKEKVIRIIIATFSNILKKVEEKDIKKEAALQMVQCKTLKTLELTDAKKYGDTELEEDVEFLTSQLQLSVQDLSSFDEYCSEVRSGRLQWSPVHKSDKFWRENAPRFNEKNFELIKILIRLLETSQDPLILCVAAHDVGEYVRHYPRGKTVIEQYQGKQAVMRLLTAEDPNVRYHALLAVQKLMVHNWEYLGKQLDVEAPETVAVK
ncbi:unnamed protein product [Cylicocyclus nassatus]|uniref:Probable V-type proton ATPase subunit H 2 n=2 Tax=Strongylidae TaxID=27830 RepID=A0AA36H470_CYLNA|nr:unnamed protein product [Cylicocyclus nassatus]